MELRPGRGYIYIYIYKGGLTPESVREMKHFFFFFFFFKELSEKQYKKENYEVYSILMKRQKEFRDEILMLERLQT